MKFRTVIGDEWLVVLASVLSREPLLEALLGRRDAASSGSMATETVSSNAGCTVY